MSEDVLVLNSDYEPLNVCNMRRAMSLMFLGKVDVLHANARVLHSIRDDYHMPSVVRLRSHVRRPKPQLRLSRKNILARDKYTCQYCGQKGGELTLDHVTPRRLGGLDTWENLVCCCSKCNNRKGGKTLAQMGLSLQKSPDKPKYVPIISFSRIASGAKNEDWSDYLPAIYDCSREPKTANDLMANAAG